MKILRIIKIILSILLALSLIICMGIFIFFQTFDTDQYLPQITNKIALALGRPVSIDHLGLGLSSMGITLDAGPLTIADDKNFTLQPFIKIDLVRVNLDLGALIFQHKIHLTNILLESPQIHFIRSVEGIINVRSISQISRKNPVILSEGPHTGHSLVAPKDLNKINSIKDSSAEPQNDVNALHNDPNTTISPSASYINIKSIKIQDASISLIDQSAGMPLDIWLKNINVSLHNFSLSSPFRFSFDASLYSAEPNVHGSALILLDLPGHSIQINNLSFHTDLSRLDIEGLKGISPQLRDNPIFENISGALQLNMSHLSIGSSGTLEASGGEIIITNGVIKNFNVIKTVLSRTLRVFGDIDGLINGQLKGSLGAKDTVIERADTKFSFHDKAVFIDDSVIKTNIFEFSAKGSMDQGFNMDMQTVLHLNEDVSATLINRLEGLKYLCDDSNRITIEASLKGVYPHFKYKPNKDFKKKSRKTLNAVFRQLFGA